MIKGHGERTGLPSRDEVIAFIRAQTGEVGTREIARPAPSALKTPIGQRFAAF